MKQADVIIIGGGAAGFFTAINAAEKNPDLKIIILERGKEVLTKVKVSGGGRCNVTHAEFLPKELTQNYPRGEKELLGPFHTFMTGDTIEWFEKRGVAMKIEEDGRMFPVSDSSQTIINCFLSEVKRFGVEVLLNQSVKTIQKDADHFIINTTTDTFSTAKIVVATGSNPKIWQLLEGLGHTVVPAVPSLFTFNIKDGRILDLPGLSTDASVKVLDAKGKAMLESNGPLLITHWGMSGPAILKLSAWGARVLEPLKYHFNIEVNWLNTLSEEDALDTLKDLKALQGKQTIFKYAQFELPKRLWQSIVKASGIDERLTWADATRENLQNIANQLTAGIFEVTGKSTFKEEFVTAGGVDLKEVNFKTFESKICQNLFFAGEVLNIDAITGGFNFQNAWTGGYIVSQNL
ncbi:BaiN/RdsA family NAD(P)/FAD-dependent oxidoreductase [Aequorivita antarctica]|uniref:NAD(P)/FAD-dependent oxidoreductase n=1 Tax=Aequorivita antarctica TaxID=153266 RepID=A0A5C6YWR8_9FLAO|nr:NAD(P)/FAD-dependent oxidoreductase [Aequorivita antarctica]TXD71620.1 NAD(P)/FAD-dependent oxidoreductase [Aequorivita antarctica]SRX75924.1 Ferredoxin--NADP reductase [Aequorivita antarctica]